MTAVVIYCSKSGNTKALGEPIAERLGAEAQSINLMEKKGQGSNPGFAPGTCCSDG